MFSLSAECVVGQESPAGNVSAQLFRLTHEMWLLLSGVVDKPSADAAAARFQELAEQSAGMSDSLLNESAMGLDVDALNQDTYRIAEAYEDLSYEFESLCRTHCYGSTPLIDAFLTAMRLGVFCDDEAESLQLSSYKLSERDAELEIQRLKEMEVIDRELISILTAVQDEKTATEAAEAMRNLTERMSRTVPAMHLSNVNFPEKHRPALSQVCAVLEPLLWTIRTEIVRIVGLPGYDREPFDLFSDALDSVYESLGDTHHECFDGVFDSSFRTDLDDALHENSTNS